MKAKDIRKLSKPEREKKLKELKMELIKSKANAAKGGSARTKDIKKIIARIHTINTLDEKEVLKNK
jgi:ribosomal protein L29